MTHSSLKHLEQHEDFISRHIGPRERHLSEMLKTIGYDSIEALIDDAVPADVRDEKPLDLHEPWHEAETLEHIREIASRNQVYKSYIGMGYTDCITPAVILRNVLENPAWYTAYTPYQAEIAQGRLEALLNFQTMATDLTGMEIANASMLDEGTAAAEAMAMCYALTRKKRKQSHSFWVMNDVFPQTREILETRAHPLGIRVESGALADFSPEDEHFGILLQNPAGRGGIADLEPVIEQAKAAGLMVVVAADLLGLTLLKPPGEMGADVVVGSAQRFGVPMGYGGPHAAFFATRESYKRTVPGRIVGVSVDRHGKPAMRLALQTREQHIRREKATSNICTSQVLLAVMAGMYAVYHGPERLRKIARRVHRLTATLARGLEILGHETTAKHFFDTVNVKLNGSDAAEIRRRALAAHINLRYLDDGTVGITLDETTLIEDVDKLLHVFSGDDGHDFHIRELADEVEDRLPAGLVRKGEILTHPVFHVHHSETHMLRYLNTLASRDLSLVHSMIPLGSCTMKLNATTEMIPVTWPEFGKLHPFAPADQAKGYAELFAELEAKLSDITGFHDVSLQPNAGSQGEYSGLLVIRRYHESRNEGHRNICLIPSSAHGTNPASAVMAGMKVVVVKCDHEGNIDIPDLTQKAEAHADNLGALMITYPSTHGVFEETISEICSIIHANGGQVYLDGANMNALVGLCRPARFGADVAHLNLHKTFCIPHGGGGPGVGPIGLAEHLAPFQPGHGQRPDAFPETAMTAVSAAPWGSASILPISWAYISMMGASGLRRATEAAIINANYIAHRLEPHFPVLYKGPTGRVAHECIIDVRPYKATAGIDVEDVAKRLMDYGFHAPTMSWPVAGTLMIEPTESESREELDRFCDAMIAIHNEIKAIEAGEMDKQDNPLKNAPHTVTDLVGEWDHPYSREQAVYPLPWLMTNKFWPSVARIDNAYGDRHLVCSCPSIEEYQ
ncbi:MAG: aminomethyl-transferring glycine dehydrogenase [Acidobacteriota bacterium]|nr:aminomethyl-transferring glycine dehydrogenase [Acidobacteriota bacterium]